MGKMLIPVLLGVVLRSVDPTVAVEVAPLAQAQQRRTVYVSVMQKDGAPVTDLTAADFDIKEGGKPVEVDRRGSDENADTSHHNRRRRRHWSISYSLATLVQRLQDAAEFSIGVGH